MENREIKIDEVDSIIQIVGEEDLAEDDMMFAACPPSARCGGSNSTYG